MLKAESSSVAALASANVSVPEPAAMVSAVNWVAMATEMWSLSEDPAMLRARVSSDPWVMDVAPLATTVVKPMVWALAPKVTEEEAPRLRTSMPET